MTLLPSRKLTWAPNPKLLGAALIRRHLNHIKLGLHISYMAPHRLDHRANWQLGRVTGQASLDWHQHRCVAVVSGATIKEMTAAGDDLADSNGWK